MRFLGSSSFRPVLAASRWLSAPALFWACAISMGAGTASAIELGGDGYYYKLSFSFFPSDYSFDSNGNRQRFAFNGASQFGSLTGEYRYGASDRLNLGFTLPLISNSFENDFGSDSRQRLQDLTLVAEYRLLDFERARRVLSLRAAVTLPTGYEAEESTIWLGNGTTDLLMGSTFKQFFLRGEIDKFWYEVDLAIRRALDENRANLDGQWSLPVRLGVNYRPQLRYTLASALIGSFNDRREFLGVEGVVKFRFNEPGEVEIGITELFQGENSSAGTVFSVGFLVNSGRIWQ